MSDPYRPQYYESSYAPENPYSAGSYTGSNYGQPDANNQLQLSQSRYSPQPSPNLLSPHSTYADSRKSSYSRHTHHSRSRSRHARSHSRHRSRSRSRSHSRSRSTKKAIGAAAVGAGVGGFLGHEIGGGALGTVGGILAGAIGAQALEKKREKNKARRRASFTGSSVTNYSSNAPPSRPEHHRHRSSSFISAGEDRVADVKNKISGFLSPHSHSSRSRSHVGDGRRRRSGDRDDWSSDEEYHERRGGRRG